MPEPKKSIDNYVEGELIVRFERDVSKTFAEEFIKLFGYKVLDDSRYDQKRLKGHMLIQVPEGKEHETIETLQNYKKIIRFAELNGIVKGADQKQSSQQKTLLCPRYSARSLTDAIYERNIASIDTENKKYGGK